MRDTPLMPFNHPVSFGFVAPYSPANKGHGERMAYSFEHLVMYPACSIANDKTIRLLTELYNDNTAIHALPSEGIVSGNGRRDIDELRRMGFHIEGGYKDSDEERLWYYYPTEHGYQQIRAAIELYLYRKEHNIQQDLEF